MLAIVCNFVTFVASKSGEDPVEINSKFNIVPKRQPQETFLFSFESNLCLNGLCPDETGFG